MKRKELNETDFYNLWLKKYHNITIEKIIEEEPELAKTAEWYKKYAVTQEKHDEWYEWAITTIMKHYHIGRSCARRNLAFTYLNVAPMIIETTKDIQKCAQE